MFKKVHPHPLQENGDLFSGHTSQFKEVSNGQIWDNLRIKKKKKLENQVILKPSKRGGRGQGKHLSYLCIKVSHGNQRVDVGKLYVEKCQVLNTEIMTELEYNHFANLNEILDLCNTINRC